MGFSGTWPCWNLGVLGLVAVAGEPILGSQRADPRRHRDPAVPWALTPLPWGAVRPAGWILDWALAARHGAVSPNRSWFAEGNGTNGRSNGWKDGRPRWAMDEQSAYWIDGMMRLGLVLQDEELIGRAREDISAAILHKSFDDDGTSGWPRAVYSRAMLAHLDATGDTSILPFFEAVWHGNLTQHGQDFERAPTQCEAMLEGYAFGGSSTLLETCVRALETQEAPYLKAWVDRPCHNFSQFSDCFKSSLETVHGVTWNEVAKLFAMASGWIRGNRSDTYLEASVAAYEQLAQRDLLPHGVNSAEEALSGVAPNASTETCDVSDFIHSTTWMLRVTGASVYGDRLEQAFHNAAPAAVSRNWTQHVYFQAPNLAKIPHDMYRLPGVRYAMQEAHDPACCTGNQARLLPNYIHHMWMSSQDQDGTLGLTATMYGPGSVEALVGPQGKSHQIRIDVTTLYPFDVHIHMKVRFEPGVGPVKFPLGLRLPSWCRGAMLQVAGKERGLSPDAKGFHVLRRLWTSGDTIELDLPMEPRVELQQTVNNGGITGNDDYGDGNRNNYVVGGLPYATVLLGPLLFALPLESGDDWQFALDPQGPVTVVRSPWPKSPWDWPLAAPVRLVVRAQRLSWQDVWHLPSQTVKRASSAQPGNSSVELELVPYGCTKVFRVSMFPYVSFPTADGEVVTSYI